MRVTTMATIQKLPSFMCNVTGGDICHIRSRMGKDIFFLKKKKEERDDRISQVILIP